MVSQYYGITQLLLLLLLLTVTMTHKGMKTKDFFTLTISQNIMSEQI